MITCHVPQIFPSASSLCHYRPSAVSLVADWYGDFLEISFTVKHTPVWLYSAKLSLPRLVKCLEAYVISAQIW